jgi:hypothetical protein
MGVWYFNPNWLKKLQEGGSWFVLNFVTWLIRAANRQILLQICFNKDYEGMNS